MTKAAAPQPQISSSVENITPDVALAWLDLNRLNRNINRHHVMSLAAAMTRGEWHLNGQSISFDSTGTLQDGQHRLLAVVKSGQTVPMLVVRNVDPSARSTVDVGRKRTVADELTMQGEKNTILLGAILMMKRRIDDLTGRGANVVLTSIQATEMVAADPDYRTAASIGEHLRHHAPVTASVLGYTSYKFLKVSDRATVDRFWEPFMTGAFTGPGDPRFVLQKSLNRLATDKTFSAGQFSNKVLLAALVVKAWNAWRKGKSIQLLRHDKSAAFPKAL
jgi:hypothetical protein